ncbi:MAG TPA: dihydrodipicolinate reductase C-terminal domain-containing protein [Paludibacteraceae bacterium]|nr:dihydrodipicolinate reductase C-terminal domain-containing protein [Paludibacteraceae bacterium]
MKIGLIGFGKTGKAVASVILQNPKFDLQWVLRRKKFLDDRNAAEILGVESDNQGLIHSIYSINIDELLDEQPVDAIIDFSSEEGIYIYGQAAAQRKIKIISAVSHYKKETKDFLKSLSKKTTVFWSPNITLGVNYLLICAKFLKKIAPWVDIQIIEEHFKGKKNVSGTAITIAEALDINKTEINSVRAGGIIGKHEVIFGFPYQTVRLIHESISREAFGNGVLFVAENLENKETGLYNFEELLLPYFTA